MEEKKNDIKSLQLFRIIRQQYVAQLLESFKQEYRDKNNNKEPNKELVNTFLSFLEKQSDLIDQLVERALQETVDHVKEKTSRQTSDKEIAATTPNDSPTPNKGREKFKEIVIMPFLIAGAIYTVSQKDWVTSAILGFVILFLVIMWWFRKR